MYDPVCNLSYIPKAVVSTVCRIGPCRLSECHAIRVTAQHGCLPEGRRARGLSAAVHSGHALDSRPATPVNAPGIGKQVQGTLVTVSYAHLTPISLLFYFASSFDSTESVAGDKWRHPDIYCVFKCCSKSQRLDVRASPGIEQLIFFHDHALIIIY
jgi:hypothetical protein